MSDGAEYGFEEYPASNGPADYALFCDHRPLAVVEAVRRCVDKLDEAALALTFRITIKQK